MSKIKKGGLDQYGALILLILLRCISHLLTYLLTYFEV